MGRRLLQVKSGNQQQWEGNMGAEGFFWVKLTMNAVCDLPVAPDLTYTNVL